MDRLPGSSASAAAAFLVVAVVAAGAARPAESAASRVAAQTASARLLDVPYLSQTEDLCGGAAVAMVLRYWGERQVYPEDFAGLVDRSASGIRTDALAAEVGRRGWHAVPLAAGGGSSGEWIRQHVDRGRPVVALVEVRPHRYHYLVIVAWTGEQVVAHDPARAPFRVMPRAEFDRAWAAAGRWGLLILPDGDRSPVIERSPLSRTSARPATSTCGALVEEMVQAARAGEVAGAETGLLAATRLCPRDPAAWRELAGVRFLQSRWAEASADAERAALLDPGDEQGWNLLATSRFLNDEPDAALEAWNRIGRPSVDLVRLEGDPRTRSPVIVALVDLPARTLLTAEGFGRAARRLHELPSAAVTSLRYRPSEGGLAEIEAAVVERQTVPRGVAPTAAAAVRAWLQRELSLDVAAPTGSGERWTTAWRWWKARPRVLFALAFPSPAWLPGVTTIEGTWERQSYATPGLEQPQTVTIHTDERRRATVTLADWATSHVRWEAGAGLDRWAERSHLSVDGALYVRFAGDRLSVGVDAAAWVPLGSAERFVRGGVSSAWRSSRDARRTSWSIWAGLIAASAEAPFDLWPGAGTGHARAPLLRAHPLLDGGVIGGPVFGRRLAHGTVEYQRALLTTPAGSIRVAVFADTARAWRRIGEERRSALHADVGAGVRVALPGNGGTARVDVARGLRDGRVVLSAGWQAPWPGR